MSSRLELLGEAHCEAVLELSRRNADRFKAGALSGFPQWSNDYPRWVGKQMDSLDDVQDGRLVFGIMDAEKRLIGVVGVNRLQRFHGACLWYAIDAAHQGRGLVKTAVLQAMLAFNEALIARGQRPPPRWVLHALPANARSLLLAESLGFNRDEMLDYTKHESARGPGRKLVGLALQCSTGEVAARLRARMMEQCVHTSPARSMQPARRKATT